MSEDRLKRRALERLAENKIRQAVEEGKLDHVHGMGRPLPDLDEPYDPDWWIKKWIRRERLEQLGRERKDAEADADRRHRRRVRAMRALDRVRAERRR